MQGTQVLVTTHDFGKKCAACGAAVLICIQTRFLASASSRAKSLFFIGFSSLRAGGTGFA
jgi:hypothetical protein